MIEQNGKRFVQSGAPVRGAPCSFVGLTALGGSRAPQGAEPQPQRRGGANAPKTAAKPPTAPTRGGARARRRSRRSGATQDARRSRSRQPRRGAARSGARRPAARGSAATPPTATAQRTDGEERSRRAAQPKPQGAAREEGRGEPPAAADGTPRAQRAASPPSDGRAAAPGRAKRRRTERSERSTPAKRRSGGGRAAAQGAARRKPTRRPGGIGEHTSDVPQPPTAARNGAAEGRTGGGFADVPPHGGGTRCEHGQLVHRAKVKDKALYMTLYTAPWSRFRQLTGAAPLYLI